MKIFDSIKAWATSFINGAKAVLATWNSPSGTSWINDYLRDQPLHMLMGTLIGFCAGGGEWFWLGFILAFLFTSDREGEQWGTLKTPSIKDSLIDSSFVMLGSIIGVTIRHCVLPYFGIIS